MTLQDISLFIAGKTIHSLEETDGSTVQYFTDGSWLKISVEGDGGWSEHTPDEMWVTIETSNGKRYELH